MQAKQVKKNLLLSLSVLTCSASLFVFVYFLLLNNASKAFASTSIYTPEQILFSVNLERQKQGLPDLLINEKLNNSAQAKGRDMVEKSYFSHISPIDGKKWSDFIKEQNYTYSIAGENLANGFVDTKSMVQAWMDSPSHRENILNNQIEETGVSISYGKIKQVPTIFVVQVFAKELERPARLDNIHKNDSTNADVQKNNFVSIALN